MTSTPPEPTATPPAPTAPPQQPPAPPAPQQPDKGFPDNTPKSQMTPEQQLRYEAFHGRKWEERAKGWHDTFGGRTPEQVKAALDEAEALKRQQMPPEQQAIETAKEEARRETAATFASKLVAAEFKAALAHVDGERRDQIIGGLNLSAYLTSSGDVDTDKVKSFAAAIAPADKGTGTGRQHDYGAGRRDTPPTGGSVAAVMAARAAARAAKQSTSPAS